MSASAQAARARRSPSGPEQLAAVLAAGGTHLKWLLERTENRLDEVSRGHGDALARFAADTLEAGGKRLRPMLVFICADHDGSERLVEAAVSVELLHMATLVHDDVLDRATLRRGRPTVFAAGGRSVATATGDLLFSRAFDELTRTASADAVRALSAASTALARGELMQRADAWSDCIDKARYIERCELKTARLFEAACRIGALLGTPGGRAIEALGTYGSYIGIAFQIFDDILDVAGPTERTGKRRGADLLDGTVTLPLIIASRREPGVAELNLRDSISNPDEAEALCERIAATGALLEARDEALGYVSAAKRVLDGLSISERQRRTLELVADGVVERYA